MAFLSKVADFLGNYGATPAADRVALVQKAEAIKAAQQEMELRKAASERDAAAALDTHNHMAFQLAEATKGAQMQDLATRANMLDRGAPDAQGLPTLSHQYTPLPAGQAGPVDTPAPVDIAGVGSVNPVDMFNASRNKAMDANAIKRSGEMIDMPSTLASALGVPAGLMDPHIATVAAQVSGQKETARQHREQMALENAQLAETKHKDELQYGTGGADYATALARVSQGESPAAVAKSLTKPQQDEFYTRLHASGYKPPVELTPAGQKALTDIQPIRQQAQEILAAMDKQGWANDNTPATNALDYAKYKIGIDPGDNGNPALAMSNLALARVQEVMPFASKSRNIRWLEEIQNHVQHIPTDSKKLARDKTERIIHNLMRMEDDIRNNYRKDGRIVTSNHASAGASAPPAIATTGQPATAEEYLSSLEH